MSVHKPVLVMVADTRDWAFDNIAQNVACFLDEHFELSIIYQRDFKFAPQLIAHALFDLNADFLHFFWREVPLRLLSSPQLLKRITRGRNISLHQAATKLSETVITSTVYDHLKLDNDSVAERQGKYGLLDAYATCSRRLDRIYREKYQAKPVSILQDGVDPELFMPMNLDRLTETGSRRLRVGWAGNSAWMADHSDEDNKGFHSILMPALNALIDAGYPVEGVFADRDQNLIPRAQMPAYYGSIDVLVCVSKHEGTPNPVLEAMACGVPVISTDVGIVRDVLGPLQQEFILASRDIDSLRRALLSLLHDPAQLALLSSENLQYMAHQHWICRIPAWLEMLRRARQRNADQRGLKLRFLLAQASQCTDHKNRADIA